MNELITGIYEELLNLCRIITDGHELAEDLRQEVVLDLLEGKHDYDQERDLLTYAFGMAYKKWYLRGNTKLGGKDNGSFNYKFRDFNLVAGTDVLELRNLYSEIKGESPEEKYKNILETLDPLERFVISEYTRRNCKVSQMAIDTGLSRQQLTKRIDFIKQKIKREYGSNN